MVGRSQRKKKQKQLLGSHQRCWLWGRHLVRETLAAGTWPILQLSIADDLDPDLFDEARHLASDRGLAWDVCSREALTRLCRSPDHQGYVAKMGPFPYASIETLISVNVASPLYLVLDELQDPYNFGAIIRSAEVFAVDGLCVGTKGQAEVSSFVARSSAGAVNRLPIGRAETVADALRSLRQRGLRVVGASEKGAVAAPACNFRQPVAIVIGNEGSGLSGPVQELCDEMVAIPQQGQTGSLNAAMAAAILLYEVRRQRSS
ncbi:MAG TPA: RNA methyltransferase [Planctomycetaceae bacterium]|nr:RNA methyltransferase [Planctomycetaceae bacterium]